MADSSNTKKKPADKTPDEFQEEIDSLKKDLHSIHEDFQNMAGTAYKRGRAKAKHYGDEAQDQWENGVEAVHQRVEEHPVSTIAIAAGVGFVLGMFFSRK